MLKEHSYFVRQIIAGIDCLLILAAFLMSYYMVGFGVSMGTLPLPLPEYWVMPVAFTFFYLYFAWTRSLFSVMHFVWMSGMLLNTFKVFLYAGSICATFLYISHISIATPRMYGIFLAFAFALISIEKIIVKVVTARMRSGNYKVTPVIVFGRGREASRICRDIDSNPEWGIRIIYKMDITTTVEEFRNIVQNSYVEEVFFCVPRKVSDPAFSVDPYVRVCEDIGRSARIFINMSSVTRFAKWDYHQFLDRATLLSHTIDLDPDHLVFKRLFDVAGSLVGVFVLVMLYPLLAVIIKATSPGPVFFKQIRVGQNGKRFIMYKFRSMYVDAEERKKELEAQNECTGAVFKMKDDPRVTNFGRFMRRFSIDELPQFIDVLRGEMSLVGTRPPTPQEVDQYNKWHHRRVSIRPGMTGLWQVSGRNKITDFDQIAKLDLTYIDRWSIWLDVKIILKTFYVVFRRDSAY